MNNELSWGTKLQHLRKSYKLSQGKLAEELSCFHLLLSEEEQSTYRAGEVEFYVSLDKTAISDYENGNRKIPERSRLLFFICYFHKKGKITIKEANTWLYSAGLRGLDPQECKIIFGDKETYESAESDEEGDSNYKEGLKNSEKRRKTIYLPADIDVVSIDRKKFPQLSEVLLVFIPISLVSILFTGDYVSQPAVKHRSANNSHRLEQARQLEQARRAEESIEHFVSEKTSESLPAIFWISYAGIGLPYVQALPSIDH